MGAWQDDWKMGYVPPKPRNWQWVLRKGRWRGFSQVGLDSIRTPHRVGGPMR